MNDTLATITLTEAMVRASRVLGFEPRALTPDEIYSKLPRLIWGPLADWEALDDADIANQIGLLSKPIQGNLLIVTEASFGTARGAFLVDGSSLREEIARSAQPEREVTDSAYDDLLEVGLRAKFRGAKNLYLEERLARERGGMFQVVGAEERLEACPCCGYRSLSQRGAYEICPVCFWEDDGSNDPERYSGPNHMTLKEARAKFERIGARSDACVAHVVTDAKDVCLRG